MIDKKLEPFVEDMRIKDHIPGVAIAISKHGKTIYEKGFGYRNLDTKEPVTPNTVFGTASVSKSFTALAMIQLAEQGLLSLHDSVLKYLPELRWKGFQSPEDITIAHLLSHSTGLPPLKRREELNRLHDHIGYLNEVSYEPLGAPGAYFSYCNDAFLLAGAIIERLTGKLYRRYMTHFILDPLQMDRSTFQLEELFKMDDVTVPYVMDTQTKKLQPVEWPRLGNYEVGGGVRSSVKDLLKYASLFTVSTHQKRPASIDQMWKPVVSIGTQDGYGLGLRVTPKHEKGYTLVEHGGDQPGVSSHFGFIPEKGVAAVVLTNRSGVSAERLWLAAIYATLGEQLNQKRLNIANAPFNQDRFYNHIGEYYSAESGSIRFHLENDQPYASIDGQTFDMQAHDEETYFLPSRGTQVRFFSASDLKTWAVLFGTRMYRKL